MRRASIEFREVSTAIESPITKFGGQPVWVAEPAWYTYVAEEALAIPFEIFGGSEDDTVERSELEAWRNHSQAQVGVQTFPPGNHFYLQQSSKSVTKTIVRKLQGL